MYYTGAARTTSRACAIHHESMKFKIITDVE